MIKPFAFALALACLPLFGVNQKTIGPFQLEISTDKEKAVYQTGEAITFGIRVLKNETPVAGIKLFYKLSGDGGLEEKGTLTSTTDGITVQTRLDRPGFVLLSLKPELEKQKKMSEKARWSQAGAAVAPEKIVVSRPVPDDFDAFWQKQLAYLKSIPYTIKTTPVEVTGRFAGKACLTNIWLEGKDGKLNANGQLAAPSITKPGSHPLIATFNGASRVGARADQSQAVNYNALVFNMNLHDLPPNIAKKDVWTYRQKVKSYQYNHSDDINQYAMRDIFLRVVRTLEYLKTRPEWDGKTLVVRGGSLGGCQAILAAALDQDVTLCAANAAAMCDHTGYLAKQASGWPQLLRHRPEAIKLAPYFDTANFATRLRCPTFMTVGFIDTTCPPTATYAAYNNIAGVEKKMYHSLGGSHGGSTLRKGEPGVYGFTGDQVARHIRRKMK